MAFPPDRDLATLVDAGRRTADNERVKPVRVVDSHTAGEPTRVVVDGGPDLGHGDLASRRDRFRRLHDDFRSGVINEPRGSEVIVGALLCEPLDRSCAAGVIFFNNVGVIGMCGHGTIGVVATLAYLGRMSPGRHRIETPVGPVTTEPAASGKVSADNVATSRSHKPATADVAGAGTVTGDIAWGGNWFFLIERHAQDLALARVDALTRYCQDVRRALNAQGHDCVDHVELFAPVAGADGKSFVLCPGDAYDRSP